MWLSVKELADKIGITTRSVQKKISSHELSARKKDGRSYEVDLASLPSNWKALLPAELQKEAGALTPVQSTAEVLSPALREALGTNLSPKAKLKVEVAKHYLSLDPMMPESQRAAVTATFYDVSPATVRRYAKEFQQYGVLGEPKEAKASVWDPEAIRYLQGYYLSFVQQTNIQQKKRAWEAVQAEAKRKGWSIGGRSSAYQLLNEIPEILIKYAVGGNRALDNFYYIKRDWDSMDPGQIWIGDQHICDWWVIDPDKPDKPYRPVLYVWEDGCTRMVAGISVGRDSYDSDTVIDSIANGIRRFGFFGYTYNDNGTAECSKVVTQMAEEIMILSDGKSQMKDISDFYLTNQGTYIVEDPETGEPARAVQTPEEWRAVHKRIYANVKNAKAKPIERLFDTLESMMQTRGIPGRVVDPKATADQEEKEQKNLDRWKEQGMLLTIEQFMREFISVIDEYEHTYHSTLKMTPYQKLAEKMAAGWVAKRPEREEDLDFICLPRGKVKVKKGRVTIDGVDYIGEDLPAKVTGFVDVGLTMHEGEYVQVRWNKFDREIAYAVFPESSNSIRRLVPVKAIDMLDDEAVSAGIAWKRGQMKITRELFRELTCPEGNLIASHITKRVQEADRAVLKEPEPSKRPIAYTPDEVKAPLWHSDYERYEWCLGQLGAGEAIREEDAAFMARYEKLPKYQAEKPRWDMLRKIGGIK